MASPASGSADWAKRVANALDDLVIYERQHENALRGLLAQGRRVLGLPQAPYSHSVGDRVSRYISLYTSGADGSSEYETNLALEIMYGPIDAEQRYKLATWAAYLLGRTAEGRKDTYEAMTGFYRARSRIVHGRASGNEGAAEAFDSGFKVALRTLTPRIHERPG